MYHTLRRLAAFGLDSLLLGVYALVLFAFVSPFVRPLFSSALTAELTGFLLLTLPFVLYFAISEASSRSATLGKRLLHLHVVTTKGKGMTFGRSLARSALKFAPWELAHYAIWNAFIFPSSAEGLGIAALVACYLLVFAYLIGIILKPHRPLYDRLAGTVVK
jgi:uncharacterized RDD family membrane protein YckC